MVEACFYTFIITFLTVERLYPGVAKIDELIATGRRIYIHNKNSIDRKSSIADCRFSLTKSDAGEFVKDVKMLGVIKPVPLDNSYEVTAGKVYAGEYPGGISEKVAKIKIDSLSKFGITDFIDLTEEGECKLYTPFLPKTMQSYRFPVSDPELAPLPVMHNIIAKIDELVAAGKKVYIHCRGGIDRTGAVVACWYAHTGLDENAAFLKYKICWETNPKAAEIDWTPTIQQKPEYIAEFIEFEKKKSILSRI